VPLDPLRVGSALAFLGDGSTCGPRIEVRSYRFGVFYSVPSPLTSIRPPLLFRLTSYRFSSVPRFIRFPVLLADDSRDCRPVRVELHLTNSPLLPFPAFDVAYTTSNARLNEVPTWPPSGGQCTSLSAYCAESSFQATCCPIGQPVPSCVQLATSLHHHRVGGRVGS